MEVTETSAEGLKREFRVVVPAGELEDKVVSRLDELGRTIRLPGFRPGKVPMQILRRRYGPSVLGEVLESTVQGSSADTIRDHNLRPALPPKVDIVSFGEGADLEYKMLVEILPDIPEPNFADLGIERLVVEVPEQSIDAAIERIAEQQRKSEPVERPAQSGDILVVDVEGRVEDREIPGASGKDRQIALGSGSFIPGFEEQLIGAAAGEHRTVRVSFPEDYAAAELAGKEAEFAVEVKEVRERAPAAIDDELGKAVGLESLAELRQEVQQQMQRDYTVASRLRLKRALLDKLAERYDFPVPAGMVELEFNNIWAQHEAELERQKAADAESEAEAGSVGGEEAAPDAEAAAPNPEPAPDLEPAPDWEPAPGAASRAWRCGRNRCGRQRGKPQGRIRQDRRAPCPARPAACRGRAQQQYHGDPGGDQSGDHPRGAAASRLRAPGAGFLPPEPRRRGQSAGADFRGQGRRLHRRTGQGRRAPGDPAGVAGPARSR